MSEMANETRTSSASNAFTRKLGPLPLWAWMGIGLALALGYYFWEKNKSSSSSQASTSTENGTTEPADQVPPYIIQNYVSQPGTPTPSQTVTAPTNPVNPTAPPTPPPPPTNTTRPTSIIAPGTDMGDINQIAKKYGLTEQELIAANPGLRKMKVTVNGKSIDLIGSGAPIPAGTKIVIPAIPSTTTTRKPPTQTTPIKKS